MLEMWEELVWASEISVSGMTVEESVDNLWIAWPWALIEPVSMRQLVEVVHDAF